MNNSLLIYLPTFADSPEENDKFAKAQRLPFPLLTDASSILRKTFGIPNDFMGLLPGRQTYVIDKNGMTLSVPSYMSDVCHLQYHYFPSCILLTIHEDVLYDIPYVDKPYNDY